MLSSFLLALREGLEAALIVGIVLGALRKLGRSELAASVWKGAVAAAAVSLGAGVGLTVFGLSLEGEAEAIFEGLAMLLAAGVLTWMIFWMNGHARNIRGNLESGVRGAIFDTGTGPLFGLAFLAVVREGIELALFLTAAALTAGTQSTVLGGLLGLAAAVFLGWSIFASTMKLDLRRFFQVTGVLLLLFAAGLVGHGVHEFNEVGWIPALIEHVWDVNPLVDEASTIGLMLKALLGYNGDPSLSEVVLYLTYLVGIGFMILRLDRRASVPAAPAPA